MAQGLTLDQLQKMGAKPAQKSGGITLDELKSRGAKQVQPQARPQEKGFFRTLIEDPFKTLLIKPADRFAEAAGRTGIFGENIKRGYEEMADAGEGRTFGGVEIEAQKAFGDGGFKQILGDAAKTTSYLYTGGAGTQAVKTGLKGEIIQGAIQGAKTGAVGGGTASFGEAIQNAENEPSDIAYKTLFGAAAGGVTGGILGAAIPVVVRGVGKIKEYSDIEKLNEKLYESNKEIFKPTSTQMADWAEKKVDPLKTFTQEFGPEAVPSSGDKLQLDDFIAQTEARYKAGAEGFNTILRNSPETISLRRTYQKGLDDINKSSLTPALKEKAKEKLLNEFDSIVRESQTKGVMLGEDNVPAWYADNLKDRFWSATKNFGSEESSVANTVNKSIGFGFKEGIEDAVTDVNVQAYNKQLQELIYLKDFLESRNGKVPGSGGKMARYTARIIGGSAGFGGGPVGSAAGAITADQVAQALINPGARTWIIRKQLQKLSPEVRRSLQAEAEQIIARMAQRRADILKLPVGNASNIPINLHGKADLGRKADKVFNESMLNIVDPKAALPERAPIILPSPKAEGAIPDQLLQNTPEIKSAVEEFISLNPGERIANPDMKIKVSDNAQFSRKSLKHFVESRLKAGNSIDDIDYLLQKAPDVIENPQLNIPNPNQKYPGSTLKGKYYDERNNAVIAILDKGGEIRDIISLHFKNKTDFENLMSVYG